MCLIRTSRYDSSHIHHPDIYCTTVIVFIVPALCSAIIINIGPFEGQNQYAAVAVSHEWLWLFLLFVNYALLYWLSMLFCVCEVFYSNVRDLCRASCLTRLCWYTLLFEQLICVIIPLQQALYNYVCVGSLSTNVY